MDKETVYNQFLNLEMEYDLFNLRVDGVRFWERIRLKTFRQILYEREMINNAHDEIQHTLQTYIQAVTTMIQSGIRENPLSVDEHNFFFFGHPRRKIRQDGYWWDNYCDPIYEEVDLDYIHMSPNEKLKDHVPRKTSCYRNLDIVWLPAYAVQKALSFISNLPEKVHQVLQSFKREINNRFGVEIDVESLVIEELSKRASRKPMYKRILRRVDPAVAVVVVSYRRSSFIETCHELGIPVVELQHGIIDKYHLGYAYPGQRKKEVFPDYLFLWGEKWEDMVELPLPSESTIPVGYPYLEEQASDIQNIASEEMVIFISQGTIGEDLSQFAIEFAKQNPKLDVIYKLHPGEYDRWETVYPWLTGAPVTVIDSNVPSLYELLARASYQVGVYSTAIYEGLFFGNKTYIADLYGSDHMERLVQQGDATLVSTASELTAAIGSNKSFRNFDAIGYFEPNATDKMEGHLQQILSEQREN